MEFSTCSQAYWRRGKVYGLDLFTVPTASPVPDGEEVPFMIKDEEQQQLAWSGPRMIFSKGMGMLSHHSNWDGLP